MMRSVINMLSSTSTMTVFLVTALLLQSAACCMTGGQRQARDPEATKRQELAELKEEQARLKAVEQAMAAGNFALMSLGAEEIEIAGNQALPMKVNANTLNSHVTGTLTISKMKNVRISRGKVHLELEGKGKNIQVSSLGRAYLGAKKVKSYVAAVQGGMTVKVSGKVTAKNGRLVYAAKASRVTLKKNKKLAGDIKNALNGSFFKKAHPIKLGTLRTDGKRLNVRDAFVLGDDVAIIFTP